MTKISEQAEQWRSMSPERYIESRVDDQLAWYSEKSTTNKNWHFRLQLLTLIAAALVPMVSLTFTGSGGRILAAVSGSIAAIAAGIVALFQFRELWIDYRATAERLKYEKFLYLTGADPYTSRESFSLFVNRVENTILSENHNWREKIGSNNVDLTTAGISVNRSSEEQSK